MQTIVKIFIALIFSHISVSESTKEPKDDNNKVQASIKIKINSCASVEDHSLYHLS